ncbi:hypothetical protein HK100_009617 [Physocladia obscura]|uniref:Uncharacterized protein n=1 Tax=Physocladia obscura TaxID=109957 RepID=A0AAD5SMH4_9FUNG|nr:hypothetical protein HK100_009617 [Physocladia obscura]
MKTAEIIKFLSTDVYHPPVNPELFGQHILLAKIVGRIMDAHKTNKDLAGELTGERNLKSLEKALQSWQKHVPANLDFNNLKYRIPADNQITNLQICFRLCVILLHIPQVSSFVRKQQQQKLQQSVHGISKPLYFQFCQTAAREIEQLVSRNQSSGYLMLTQTAFAVFQSGWIHLTAAKVSCHAVDTPEFGAQAEITAYLNLLEVMGRRWRGAAILFQKLNLIAENAKANGQYGSKCGPSCASFATKGDYINSTNGFQPIDMASNDGMTPDRLLSSNSQFSMQSLFPTNTQSPTNMHYNSTFFQINDENGQIQPTGFQDCSQEMNTPELGYIDLNGGNSLYAKGTADESVTVNGGIIPDLFLPLSSQSAVQTPVQTDLPFFTNTFPNHNYPSFYDELPGNNQGDSSMMQNNANPHLFEIDSINIKIEQNGSFTDADFLTLISSVTGQNINELGSGGNANDGLDMDFWTSLDFESL